MMPSDIAARWAAGLAEEFSNQADAEEKLGLPVTPFMTGLRDPIGSAKSQVGFVDFVLLPLVSPMFRLFEGMSPAEEYLLENRQRNNDKIAGSLGETSARSSSGGKQTHKENRCRRRAKRSLPAIRVLSLLGHSVSTKVMVDGGSRSAESSFCLGTPDEVTKFTAQVTC
jgi:hypothetical protein